MCVLAPSSDFEGDLKTYLVVCRPLQQIQALVIMGKPVVDLMQTP